MMANLCCFSLISYYNRKKCMHQWKKVSQIFLCSAICQHHSPYICGISKFNLWLLHRCSIGLLEWIQLGSRRIYFCRSRCQNKHRLLQQQKLKTPQLFGPCSLITLQLPFICFSDLIGTQTQQTTQRDVPRWLLLCSLSVTPLAAQPSRVLLQGWIWCEPALEDWI